MDAGLRGHTALITGGGTGIGRAIALALAYEGADVALAGLPGDLEGLDEFARAGVRVLTVPVDVRHEAQVVDLVRYTIEKLGAIDMYVNNAAGAWHQPITMLTAESWHRTIDTNLSAGVFACREVCRHMIARRQGSILIVGSTAQYNHAYGEAAYHISKLGLRALKDTLALEMAPYAIRVNALIPGHYATRLTAGLSEGQAEALRREIPLRRFGVPHELGAAAVLLLSDRLSPYTTGAELAIDGGLLLRPLGSAPDTGRADGGSAPV